MEKSVTCRRRGTRQVRAVRAGRGGEAAGWAGQVAPAFGQGRQGGRLISRMKRVACSTRERKQVRAVSLARQGRRVGGAGRFNIVQLRGRNTAGGAVRRGLTLLLPLSLCLPAALPSPLPLPPSFPLPPGLTCFCSSSVEEGACPFFHLPVPPSLPAALPPHKVLLLPSPPGLTCFCSSWPRSSSRRKMRSPEAPNLSRKGKRGGDHSNGHSNR